MEKVKNDLKDGKNLLVNDNIPVMAGWHCLVQPDEPLPKAGLETRGYADFDDLDTSDYESEESEDFITEGGMYVAPETVDKEDYSNTTGTLIAMGGSAFCDRLTGERWAGNWPEVGDRVLYHQTAGVLNDFDGVELRIMNDDSIKAVLNKAVKVKGYLVRSKRF